MDRIPEIFRNLEHAKTVTDFTDVAFRANQIHFDRNQRSCIASYASKMVASRNFTSEDVKHLEIEFRSLT